MAPTSTRNGYVNVKLFRADNVVDRANLDLGDHLVTEVDPADYDWDHNTDYTGVSTGPTVIPRVAAPQGVIDCGAEGTVLYDGNGIAGHPGNPDRLGRHAAGWSSACAV